MIAIRPRLERGHFNHGWLDTYHTFSFADYHDPRHMGFRALRVMNEDRVAPGQGFGKHPHRDMEIVTYVLSGALEHRDSMGNGEILRPGEFQRMTAGTGIQHSEFNPSATEPVHLYQIWLLPSQLGLEPSYEQRAFPAAEMQNRLRLVASPDGREGSLSIHQDADILLGQFSGGATLSRPIRQGRHLWVQILQGEFRLGRNGLVAGDGVAMSDEPALELAAEEPGQVMVFDLN